ncbi:MAG: Ig domain-containing protein, partial [Clostridia bacterium]|nr:Ig domain-containing protein [Clostridia bacterium]
TGLVYWTDYAKSDFSVISSQYIYDGYSTTETGWKEMSILFSLKDTAAPLTQIDKLQLQRGGASEVYFDDFKIEEYKVGMNLAPNSNGGALPITNVTHLLANFSVALDKDSDNNVWKFSDANASPAKKFNFNGLQSVMAVGNEFEVSFRYKGVDNAAATAQLAIPDTSAAEFVEGPTNSAADPNTGWKTCTATFRVKRYDAAYTLNMRFTHATEVLVDDFVLAQRVSVDIAEETKAIGVGDQVTLNATIVPADADVVWTSNNDKVATVDQTGKVTGVALGEATITATVNGVKSDSCVVSVIIPATDLTLNKTQLHLAPGAYQTLSVTATPANATVGTITWSSNNTAVATVDNGKVTAVANGTATITATNGTLSTTCTVTVDAYGNRFVGGDMESDKDVVWQKVTEDIGAFVAEPGNDTNQVLKVNAGVTDGFRYVFATGLYEANTVYTFTGRVKGTGAKFELNGSHLQSVMSGAVNVIQVSPAAGTDGNTWVDFAVTFKTKSSVNAAYALYIYNTSDTDVAYFDDLKLVKRQMDLQITTGSTNKSLIRLTDTDGNSLTDEDFERGSKILVQIVPVEGEMLKPGTLGYQTGDEFVKIINRLESDTTGQTFEMTIPEGEFTLKAEFQSTTNQSFAFDTIATSVHIKERTTNEVDGVRFLTRMYLNGGLSAHTETGKLQVTYNGQTYDVVSMGTLLRRKPLENAEDFSTFTPENGTEDGKPYGVWKYEAYNAENNKLYRKDKTDAYIDFAVSMMTRTPSDTFNARVYQARGYIELGNGEVIYTDSVMEDSVNSVVARFEAQS